MIELRDPLEAIKQAAAEAQPPPDPLPLVEPYPPGSPEHARFAAAVYRDLYPPEQMPRNARDAAESLAKRPNVTTAIDTPSLTSTGSVGALYSNCDITACGRLVCDGCRECEKARRRAETEEILAHLARNKQRECGVPLLQRYGQTRRGRWVRVSCKNKRCPDCGPEKRAARVAWFTKETQGRQIYRVVIGNKAQWDRLRKRAQRHIEGGGVVVGRHIPAVQRGHSVVLWTLPMGELVEDAAQAFDEALRADPIDGRKVTPIGRRPGGSAASLEQPRGASESLWRVEALVTGHRSRVMIFDKLHRMGYQPKDLEELPDDLLDGFEFIFPLPEEDGYLEVLAAFGAVPFSELRKAA